MDISLVHMITIVMTLSVKIAAMLCVAVLAQGRIMYKVVGVITKGYVIQQHTTMLYYPTVEIPAIPVVSLLVRDIVTMLVLCRLPFTSQQALDRP